MLIEELIKDVRMKKLKKIIFEARRDLDAIRSSAGPPPGGSFVCLKCHKPIDDEEMEELRYNLEEAMEASIVGKQAAHEVNKSLMIMIAVYLQCFFSGGAIMRD